MRQSLIKKWLSLFSLLFVGTIFFAVRSDDKTNIPPSDDSKNEWPTKGETESIAGGWPIAVYRMPVAAVQATKKILRGDIDDWFAKTYEKPPFKDRVLWVYDEEDYDKQDRCVVFLIQPDRWIRLNDPQGLPFISDILNLTKDDLNESQFGGVMHDLSCLYKGCSGRALTSQYRSGYDKIMAGVIGWSLLVTSPEQIPGLRALCGETIVIKDKTFRFNTNFLTNHGSVDNWGVSGSINDKNHLELTDIAINQLKPYGTYQSPSMGDF